VLDRLGALDQRVDVRELLVGQRADVAAGVGAAVVRARERRDLLEREPGALGDFDDRQAVQDLLAVAALSADALGLRQHAGALVEADVRRVDAGAVGDLPDREQRLARRSGHLGSRP
jgi:hypothetical protein